MTASMPLRGPVLAATDLSDDGASTVRQAWAVASDLDVRLILCHVLPEFVRVRMLFPQDAGADAAFQSELERTARMTMRAQVAEAIGQSPDDARIVIDAGSPHSCILAQAERTGAGLIVVGAGTVALRVTRYAPCPVLIARPSPSDGAVIGATDFSDPALPAVETAVAEATRRRVKLRLIHCLDVLSPAMLAHPTMSPIPPLSQEAMREVEIAAHARLAESLRQFGAAGECLISHGPAAAGIVAAAHESGAALIVVGTRGRTGLPRLALGSVAETVIGRAPCSVLVVHLTTGLSDKKDRAA